MKLRKFGYDVTVRTPFVRTKSRREGGVSQYHLLRFRVFSINTFHIPLEVSEQKK